MEEREIIRELERLKGEIDKAKQEKAKGEGRLQNIMERLEKEFGIANLEEAHIKLMNLVKEKEQLMEKINKQFQQLREKYEW